MTAARVDKAANVGMVGVNAPIMVSVAYHTFGASPSLLVCLRDDRHSYSRCAVRIWYMKLVKGDSRG